MKNILIITYYWPPSGGSGVQRWLKFSKYLPENGWKPIIYTPESPLFNIMDKDLLNDVHNEVEVWKTPIWEPYSIKNKLFGKSSVDNAGIIQDKSSIKNKLMNWVRGNIFIPDPKIFWVKPSVKYLNKKIQEECIDYIVSTGPPHSMHLIALGLKKMNPKLKWISDFRDPWSEIDLLNEFYLTKKSRLKYKKLEKEVLDNSDVCLTVSETWVDSFKELGSSNVKLITNGFDEDDFRVLEKEDDSFVIGHFGLLNHLRNPKNLWKTLNEICEQNPEFNEKLEIRLSGNIDTEVLQSITKYFHLKGKLKVLGYLSHKEVLNEYNNSSVLLLLLFNSKSGRGNYPGKLFEYLATKKFILSFGPKNSDTQRLMNKKNIGHYFTYSDKNLKEKILDLFNNRNESSKSENINEFSRRKLTQELSDLLNTL